MPFSSIDIQWTPRPDPDVKKASVLVEQDKNEAIVSAVYLRVLPQNRQRVARRYRAASTKATGAYAPGSAINEAEEVADPCHRRKFAIRNSGFFVEVRLNKGELWRALIRSSGELPTQ